MFYNQTTTTFRIKDKAESSENEQVAEKIAKF